MSIWSDEIRSTVVSRAVKEMQIRHYDFQMSRLQIEFFEVFVAFYTEELEKKFVRQSNINYLPNPLTTPDWVIKLSDEQH